MTDFISGFIEDADSSARRLRISNHIVILNWNNRAAEIINELVLKRTREKVVILAAQDREDILTDIDERLADTLEDGLKNRLTIIVRQGDASSAKQLGDIGIQQAKTVIILSGGVANGDKGNIFTIKTLIQVSQLIAEEGSPDGQKVVVETEDDKTLDMVDTIIAHKTRGGGDAIMPVEVNRILGQIFSQFTVMPELNLVYSALLSNEGAAFYTRPSEDESLTGGHFASQCLDANLKAIPLTVMRGGDCKAHCYYMADSERNLQSAGAVPGHEFHVSLNPDFEITDKHVVILGHNSKSAAIMEGFAAFREEWQKDGGEVLHITVIDSEADLAKQDYYRQYPFVQKIVAADVFEKDLICGAIGAAIGTHGRDLCIMILSDDAVPDEEIDADALTYLIMVQDILRVREEKVIGFDPNSVDLIVELLDPQNYDIASNYSTNNIVISNRYISKIVMQVGEKDSLLDFYQDILTFDAPGEEDENSKELYIKLASAFFSEVPGPCSAAELIRAVYHASPEGNKSVLLGYFRSNGEMVLFTGDQSNIGVALFGDEKLILFSNH